MESVRSNFVIQYDKFVTNLGRVIEFQLFSVDDFEMKYIFAGNTDSRVRPMLFGWEWSGIEMARLLHEQRLSVACEDRR